jgi:Cu(I)/Ag(I) efflux system membrane fusion protein
MTDDQTPSESAQPRAGQSWRRRLRLTFRVLQVRLRFVIVLVVAFLVVGLWGNLRNVWDTLAHRLGGSHAAQHTVSNDTEYFCPMDPGVVSDWPAVCPVCNMDLVRRKKGESVVLPEGVVARMQFSPYRIQLAGIKTSVIGRQPLSREFVVAGRLVDLPAVLTPDPLAAGSSSEVAASSNLALDCDVFAGDLASLATGHLGTGHLGTGHLGTGHLGTGRRALVSVDAWPGSKPIAGFVLPERKGAPVANGRNATVRIQIEAPSLALRPGMYCTARVAVPLAETEPFASSLAGSKSDAAAGFTAVPETAVVDTGTRRVVFVETMPGMFDGVEVTLGPRCGDFYPVLTGLEPGQKVAAIGAFLIDAEARLSPNLAAGYFGAARLTSLAADTPATPPPPAKQIASGTKKKTVSKLSQADQKLARQQKTCPVTDLPLDSMGGPIAVEVAGQRVFICCQGCESKLKKDPQKYLDKLKK